MSAFAERDASPGDWLHLGSPRRCLGVGRTEEGMDSTSSMAQRNRGHFASRTTVPR